MFKNMKLASKLYLGFGAVVVIAAVLGYMGYSSLGKVEHKVVIGDEANRFIKIVNDARLAEKNFIIRGDDKYAEEMLGQKEHIDTLVEEITAQMKVAADKQLVKKMHAEAGVYIDQAKHYVELQGKVDELTAESGPITQSARKTVKLAHDMSQDQIKKLSAVMNVQANIAEGSRAHLNWAGAVKDFLANKNATLNVETDGHKCGFGKWLDSDKYAEEAAFCGQEFRTLIENAKQKHLELHKSAIDIAAARKGTTDTSLEVYQQKTAPVLKFILGEFAKAEEILKVKVSERLANSRDAKQINELLLITRQHEKNYFLKNTNEYVTKANEQADKAIALANNLKRRFNQQVNKDQAQQVIDACLAYKKAFADVIKYNGEQKVCEGKMVAAARKLTEEATGLRVAKKEEMESVAASSNLIMITLAIAGVIVGVVLAFVITRGITKPFQNIFKGLKAFSTKELEETGQTFKRIIEGLVSGSQQTASASGQVSSASQSLAEGASEQAASLEEISTGIDEMASMVKTSSSSVDQVDQMATQNTATTKEVQTLSQSASQSVDKGTQAVERMSQAIAQIKNSSQETAKIIKTIDEIAFQTNLLALNAAVEAARAGEAGKGFAVVAEEVRNLAQRSAEAAKNTTLMIDTSVTDANDGVKVSEEVAAALVEVAEGIGKVTTNVNEVTAASEEQTSLIAEISAASKEQTQGIEQVSKAITQIDVVTQRNAANAEESASASEELSGQAEELSGMVRDLQALVGSGDSDAPVVKKDLNFSADSAGAARKTKKANATQAFSSSKKADTRSPEEAIPLDDSKELAKF